MKKSASAVCLFAAAAVIAGCQKPPEFTPQDEAAIKAMFDSVVTEVKTGKLDQWATHFTSDARFYPGNSPVLVGRAAILAWAKSLPPMTNFSFSDVAVSGEGNLAYGSSRVFLQMTGLPADTSKQLVVFRRDATGHWFVQACAVSTDKPLPAPPPAAAAPRHS